MGNHNVLVIVVIKHYIRINEASMVTKHCKLGQLRSAVVNYTTLKKLELTTVFIRKVPGGKNTMPQ